MFSMDPISCQLLNVAWCFFFFGNFFNSCFGILFPLLPWQFQSKTNFPTNLSSFLSLCPIQFHFWFLIPILISFLFIFHNSKLEILCDYPIVKILLKYQFTNFCNLFWMVLLAFHISQPYKQNWFHSVFLSLVHFDIILDFQFGCKRKKHLFAFRFYQPYQLHHPDIWIPEQYKNCMLAFNLNQTKT